MTGNTSPRSCQGLKYMLAAHRAVISLHQLLFHMCSFSTNPYFLCSYATVCVSCWSVILAYQAHWVKRIEKEIRGNDSFLSHLKHLKHVIITVRAGMRALALSVPESWCRCGCQRRTTLWNRLSPSYGLWGLNSGCTALEASSFYPMKPFRHPPPFQSCLVI